MSWCLMCPRGKYTISDLQRHASRKGGKCLTGKYGGYHKLHQWQCSKGHIWNASWSDVKSGKIIWCLKCYKEKCFSDLDQIEQ